ncbi:hypothetical protein CEP51_005132 [Fusarium floridanum]|uniref:Uncharacterized protein n=1 Tax=Fusarium floridanum TaxID=1325733 RepID=A0A428RY67_9HYPO|nr:hypothetical protein CEP51_005132 [Fusarium floridanum]
MVHFGVDALTGWVSHSGWAVNSGAPVSVAASLSRGSHSRLRKEFAFHLCRKEICFRVPKGRNRNNSRRGTLTTILGTNITPALRDNCFILRHQL